MSCAAAAREESIRIESGKGEMQMQGFIRKAQWWNEPRESFIHCNDGPCELTASAHSFWPGVDHRNTYGWWTEYVGGPIFQISQGNIHGEQWWVREHDPVNVSSWDSDTEIGVTSQNRYDVWMGLPEDQRRRVRCYRAGVGYDSLINQIFSPLDELDRMGEN
jgi:hypothetical protein